MTGERVDRSMGGIGAATHAGVANSKNFCLAAAKFANAAAAWWRLYDSITALPEGVKRNNDL